MQTFLATIEGTTSLLQHRFGESAEGSAAKSTRRVVMGSSTPRAEAEKVEYKAEDGTYYMPGAAFARLLREAGGGHKQTGSRKSVKYVVPSAVLIMDDRVTLLDVANNKPLTKYEVDSRPVVIPATKGRVMRHRPRHDSWRAKVLIRVNELLLPPSLLHQLLVEGGQQLGVGDFRPEKGGPFGTFAVVAWTEMK